MNGSQPPGLILVVDLSASLYVALLDSENRLLCSRIREQGARGESAHLLVDECLAEAGALPTDIGCVCVGVGPGSFTGIRVGVAMAQGFAFARQLPLYPFSSLAAMTVSAQATAAIAANAGQYFVRGGSPAIEALISGDELEGMSTSLSLPGSGSVLITSGRIADLDKERFSRSFSSLVRLEDVIDFPRIVGLARSRPPILDGVIRPNYLQASAAEEKRRSQEAGGLG